jgi:hypothetical protein
MRRALACTFLIGCLAATLSAQTGSFTRVGSLALAADMIEVQGGYAYVTSDAELSVIDVSDPAVPKRVGSHTFPDRIWGFTVKGSFVYVAHGLTGFAIVDVTNPAAPKVAGAFKTHGQAHAIDVIDNTALVIDHMLGVALFDVSNPAKIVEKGSVFLDGYARHVVIAGGMGYAVDSPDGFYVVDPRKPTGESDEPVSTLRSPGANFGRIISIAVSDGAGGSRIAAVTGGRTLQVIDVSKPAAPAIIASLRTPGGGQRMVMKGTLGYVADLKEGIQTVDFSTPSKPRIVATYKTPKRVLDVSLADSLIFATMGDRWDERGNRFEGDEVMVLRQTF